jgi:hypothetical protein
MTPVTSPGVIDLNDDVLTVRRLRAAAALPKILALALAVVGLFVFALDDSTWPRWAIVAASAVVLALLGRAIEHGAVWAVWLLAALVAVFTALTIAAAVTTALDTRAEPLGEFFGVLAGLGLTLTVFWLLVRTGLKAVRTRRKPPAWIVTQTRSGWQWLPRDERLPTALGSFATAVVIYAGGAVVAAWVAVGTGVTLLGALAYLPVARAAGRAWTKGRRALALRLQEVRKLDDRPPVILLRSFEDDNLPLETRFRLLWFFSAAEEAFTLEEYVVNCVWQCGPVIAVGNPREKLSPLGSAREYVPEDRWRNSIQQYLDEAALVVCILGSTPGVRWEYEAIAARKNRVHVIVVFPPRPAEQLHQRWNVFKSSFDPAASVDLSSDSRLGVPVVALFPRDEESGHLFYCRFTNETAYGVAFATLFERFWPSGEAA